MRGARWSRPALLVAVLAGCTATRPASPPLAPPTTAAEIAVPVAEPPPRHPPELAPPPHLEQVSPAQPAASFAPEPRLRVVEVRRAGDASGARVVVQLSGVPSALRALELDGPPRCVADVDGPSVASGVQESLPTGDPLLPRIRIGSYSERLRLVVDLGPGARPPCHSRLEGTAVMLGVGPRPVGAETAVVWTSSRIPEGAAENAARLLAIETSRASAGEAPGGGAPLQAASLGETSQGEQPASSAGSSQAPIGAAPIAGAASHEMPAAAPPPAISLPGQAPMDAIAPPALAATVAPAAAPSGASTAPLAEYRVGRGDALGIKFFYTPELNEEVVVRPDGRISLQLIGDVPVAGRTPAELSAEIRQRYQPHVQTRDVTVIVRDFKSARAFVGGEVRQPAVVPIDGAMTLADAIFVAGGALDTAKLASVVLLRLGPNGKEAQLVDVSAGLQGLGALPTLRPYDVVYVPKSAIAEVGTFVDLYINRIIPKSSGFFAYYQINPLSTTPQP